MKNENYSYQGWLISNSFIKRALAVVGYYIIGSILIYLILLIPVLLLIVIIG